MLSLTIGIVVFVYFTQVVPVPINGFLAASCHNHSECASDECCYTEALVGGKRFLSMSGTCKKLGTEGSYCLVNTRPSASSGMYYACPCASGFRCQGSGQYDMPLGEIGSCRGPSTKRRQTCRSGSDCAADECCVSDDRPIGRRRREFIGAHCQKMGIDGSSCYVQYGSGKPNGTVYVDCPCTFGLTCVGNEIYDIPIGEMGLCLCTK